jgi:hypothetical protein
VRGPRRRGRHRLLTSRSAVLASVAGAANDVLSAHLAPRQQLQLAAIELAFIAGIYPGMAIGSRRATAVESIAAAAFVAAALGGLARDSRATVAAGLLAHGVWDAAHHTRGIGAPTPAAYPGFCLVADLLLAIPLARR